MPAKKKRRRIAAPTPKDRDPACGARARQLIARTHDTIRETRRAIAAARELRDRWNNR